MATKTTMVTAMVLATALGAVISRADAAPPTVAALATYVAEPKAPDAGKDKQTCGYYEKSITQEYLGGGRYGSNDMNQGIGAAVPTSCDFPRPPAGKWAALQSWARTYLKDDLRPGDVVMIPANSAWEKYESTDGSTGRSVTARWYSKTHHFDINECGVIAGGSTVCEASGSKTARGINLAHFRLEEAQKAKAANNTAVCQAAAKQVIAIGRGLSKFRKDLKARGDWMEKATYKTRYDGSLSEDAAFKKLDAMSSDAAKLHTECGGAASPSTTDAEENVFKG